MLMFLRFDDTNRTGDCGPYMMPRRAPRRASSLGGIPWRLILLMTMMERAFEKPTELYDAVDLFAGKCFISKAYRTANLKACALDFELDPRDES